MPLCLYFYVRILFSLWVIDHLTFAFCSVSEKSDGVSDSLQFYLIKICWVVSVFKVLCRVTQVKNLSASVGLNGYLITGDQSQSAIK